MARKESQPETPETTAEDFRIADIELIEALPESTVEQIRRKKNAFNDLILTLNKLIPNVHFESGSNQGDDEGQEVEQDLQVQVEMDAARSRARVELGRLGEKEHDILSKAA